MVKQIGTTRLGCVVNRYGLSLVLLVLFSIFVCFVLPPIFLLFVVCCLLFVVCCCCIMLRSITSFVVRPTRVRVTASLTSRITSTRCSSTVSSSSTTQQQQQQQVEYPKRLANYTQPSVFAEFSPLAALHGAVNMGQGFPNFATPMFAKEALGAASLNDFNQYTRSAGHLSLVNALATEYSTSLSRKYVVNAIIALISPSSKRYQQAC
jgi:hypothetical protein